MIDLQTLILKRLETSPLDIFALSKGLNVDIPKLARELATLLKTGYIKKGNDFLSVGRKRRTIS